MSQNNGEDGDDKCTSSDSSISTPPPTDGYHLITDNRYCIIDALDVFHHQQEYEIIELRHVKPLVFTYLTTLGLDLHWLRRWRPCTTEDHPIISRYIPNLSDDHVRSCFIISNDDPDLHNTNVDFNSHGQPVRINIALWSNDASVWYLRSDMTVAVKAFGEIVANVTTECKYVRRFSCSGHILEEPQISLSDPIPTSRLPLASVDMADYGSIKCKMIARSTDGTIVCRKITTHHAARTSGETRDEKYAHADDA